MRTRVTDILCVLIKVLLLSEIAKWRVYFLLLIDNQMLLRRFVTFSRTLNFSEFLFSLIGGPRLYYFNVPPCLKLYVSAPLLPGPRQWRLLRDVHKAVCSGPDSWRFIRTSLHSPPHVSDCCTIIIMRSLRCISLDSRVRSQHTTNTGLSLTLHLFLCFFLSPIFFFFFA